MSKLKIIQTGETFTLKDDNCLEKCMGFIQGSLKAARVDDRLAIKAELLSEEMISKLIEHADRDDIQIMVRKILGDAVINISMHGEEFELYGDEDEDLSDVADADMVDAIRSVILRSQGENLKYSYRRGVSKISIKAEQVQRSMLKSTIIALTLGLIFGFLLRLAFPDVLTDAICTYALSPFTTMFMNALGMVIGPVVFFSIVTCLSQFKDLSELGSIGIKVMSTYMITTVIAAVLAAGIFFVFQPGEFGAALSMQVDSQAVDIATDVDTSILHTIINIVPSNFVRAFLDNNTLQIIFLAVICGVATGMIGEYSKVLMQWFEACNSLFLTITTIFARLIPIVVFCSVSNMIVNMGGKSMLSLLTLFMTHCLTVALMLVVYGLFILMGAKLNPFKFFNNIKESMFTSMMLMSSSASMPTTLNTCTKKLGISPKVSNFSIPLGATINMDGTCMYLTLFAFYLARLYGIEVTLATVMSVIVTIVVLSLGCPGVPGSGLVCLGIIATQLGVPIEGLGLVIAVGSFTDMVDTMSNVTGDIMTATLTAKREDLLDVDVFNS